MTLDPSHDVPVSPALNLRVSRRSLERVLGRCRVGVTVRDLHGRELYRNPSLQRILDAAAGADRILGAIETAARALGPSPGTDGSDPVDAPAVASASRIRTTDGDYRLRASLLPPGIFARDWTAVVTVDAAAAVLPRPGELRKRYALTPRESEVALLLADGASNGRIATRLGVSRHTARHHAQRVLEKLGLHSRKALALKLLMPD